MAKLSATGSALVYSTYLGGGGRDSGYAIDVDGSGNAYVTGQTLSLNFPIANPLQGIFGGGFSDAYVAKLNATGSALVYSSFLGGSESEIGEGIAVDDLGNVYVTGDTSSLDFPTANPIQNSCGCDFGDAFVVKLNSTGSALVYATYLGGNADEWGYGIAVDGAGNAYVTGETDSSDYPTANPLQATNGGSGDAFVAKIEEPAEKPYLVMTDVTPNATKIIPSSTLSVTDTVENLGWGSAGSFRVGYHLSVDGIYGNGDDLAITTTRVVTAWFDAGAVSTATTDILIPSTVPGGDYHLCAYADPLYQVDEWDETNNAFCSSATLPVSPPDLVISALNTGYTIVKRGHSFSISFTLKNQGAAAAGVFAAGFHLSTDATYGNGDDIPMSLTFSLPSLGGGDSYSRLWKEVVPSHTPMGIYYVCGMTDVNKEVAESDEVNNTNCTATTVKVQ